MKKNLFLILSVFTFFSCGSDEKLNLDGSWLTSKVLIDGVEQQAFNSVVDFTAQSEELYSISGNAGINSFSGEMTLKNGKITCKKDNFLKTLMAGEGDIQVFEDTFLDLLLTSDSYKCTENSLVIKNSKKKAEIYFIQNISGFWKINSFTKKGVAQKIVNSNIEIIPDSGVNSFKISGNSGVNRFFGELKIKDLKIVPNDRVASTRMMGSPEAMEFETEFLQIITTAKDFYIKDGILTFKTQNEELSFKK